MKKRPRSSTTPVTSPAFRAECSGSTVTLTLTGVGKFQENQKITLDKVDEQVVKGANGLEQPDSGSITFTVAPAA